MKQEFKDLLLQLAQNSAEIRGFNITSFTINEIRQFINDGVDKMTDSQLSSNIDKQRAQENLLRLIDGMTKYANDNNIRGELNYPTFNSSRSSICPLWPFC